MNELAKRLFDFASRVILFVRTLPDEPEYRVIRYQLVKSAASGGSNYEEAQAGSSRPDFNNKNRISLREIRESNYWLRLIKETITSRHNQLNRSELDLLIQESHELKLILGSIVQKTRKK